MKSNPNSKAMHNPPHPGGIVRRQCLEPLGLSVTEAAKALGVTRQALSDVVNERAGVSVEMAIRLSKAFGSSPETWLGMQMAHDLWHARSRANRIRVRSFKAA
jgi:antitoxin HigA-1